MGYLKHVHALLFMERFEKDSGETLSPPGEPATDCQCCLDSLTRHRGRRQMVAAVAAEENQKAACTPVPGLARTPLQVDWPSSETGAS